jgi:hypothetical protein
MRPDPDEQALPENTRDQLTDNIERTVDKTALRKVRNLVDELEAEQSFFQRQQKWVLLGGVVALVAVLVFFTARKSTEVPDAERLACEQREWQNAHGAAVAALKYRNPGMTHVEIQRQVDTQRDALLLQARKVCAITHPR